MTGKGSEDSRERNHGQDIRTDSSDGQRGKGSEDCATRLPTSIGSSVLLRQYKPFLKASRDYFSYLNNFFTQSNLVLATHGRIGRLPPAPERSAVLSQAKNLGYDENLVRLTVYNLDAAWNSLHDMQREFRNRFHALVDADRLARLERKEREVVSTAWALWFQLAYHPERHWDAANVRAKSAIERTLDATRDALVMELENTGSSDWKSRILSEKVPWEDKPALWLSIEFDEIVTLELSFIELLACLTKAIRPLEPHSLKQFTLCRFWANIVIIPIYRGKTLDGAVWRIPTFLFYGDEEILTEKRSWVRQLVNAEPEVLSQLGIEQQSTKHSDAFQQLERVLAELVPLANHLYCFKEITNKLDRVGYEILEQYFESHVHEMYKLLKRAEEVLDEFFLQFEENEILERVFNRQQLLEALRMGQECLVPRGKPANGKINHLNLTVCGEWAASLMEVIGHLKVIDWMLH